MSSVLLWAEVSTSGPSHLRDSILRVAFISDSEDEELSGRAFEAAVYHSDVPLIRAFSSPDLRGGYDENGLWEACGDRSRSQPLLLVAQQLMEFTNSLADDAERRGKGVTLACRTGETERFLLSHFPFLPRKMDGRVVTLESLSVVAEALELEGWPGMPDATFNALEDASRARDSFNAMRPRRRGVHSGNVGELEMKREEDGK